MSQRKTIHRIFLNCSDYRPDSFTYKFSYNYGTTKGIELLLSDNRACISTESTRTYTQKELLDSNTKLFYDAIRKVLLCHLILISKNLSIKGIFTQIGNQITPYAIQNIEANPPVYSLVSNNLEPPMSDEWKKESVISSILNMTKSSYDSRLSSLFSLIFAKSKLSETERFIYFWMSFNGLYSHLANKNASSKIKKENCKLIKLLKNFGYGSELIDHKEQSIIANEVISVIRNNHEEISKGNIESYIETIEEPLKKILHRRCATNQKYKITPRGYLLTQFSYYFRCNVIHADKPIALFCYADDVELKCLKLINTVLEDFIEKKLSHCFDS